MDTFLEKHSFNRRKKVLPDEIQLRFLKRLARLLTNGYSMLEALEIIRWDKQLIKISEEIIYILKRGAPMDEAFEQAKFHHTITAYLYFVKDNGDILSSIRKCIVMYEDRLKYRKKLKEIIRYPFILLVIFSILLYFINQFVLPSFADIFQSNTAAASTIAFFMTLIESFTIFVVCFGGIAFAMMIIWQINKQKFRIQTQLVIYKRIPIYRQYLRLQTSFQFATHLSTQLKTGISLKDILYNMSRQKKLPIVAYYTSLMTNELNAGIPLFHLMSKLDLLEKQLTEIFQKNTNNHALEKDLEVYADILTDELQRKIMKAITLIQPIFLIIVACFVIFIYMTLMWPMFQLIKTI